MRKIFLGLILFISGTACAQIGASFSPKWYNAAKYGCYGDGINAINKGVTGAGTPNIKIIGEHFLTNSPIGKKFRVQGGGAANVDQILTCLSVLNDSVAVMLTNVTSSKTNTTVDYGTDNTAPIQALLAIMKTAGGADAFFPAGLYLIFGALQTSINSVNPNCQIYIPLSNTTTGRNAQLNIRGEYVPQLLLPIISTQDTLWTQNCTVFKSEIDGSGTNPAVFGSPWYTNGSGTYNKTSVFLDNIMLITKSQVNNVNVAGTMSGYNFFKLNQARLGTYYIGTEGYLFSQALPSNKTYGIIMPQFLNNGNSQLDWGTISGYNTGALISDHFYAGQLTCVLDSIGVEYNNGTPGNPNFVGSNATIQDFQTEDNPVALNITGEGQMSITTWRAEHDNTGHWYSTTGSNDIQFSGAGLTGTVNVANMNCSVAGVPDNVIVCNDWSRAFIESINNISVANTLLTLTDAATVSWNLQLGKSALVTLGGNRTLAISNARAGDNISLIVRQDGTGSRTLFPPAGSYTNTGTFGLSTNPTSFSRLTGTYTGAFWQWSIDTLSLVGPFGSYVTALISAGYTPGGTEQTAYNTFYTSAVSQGIWTKIKYMNIFAGSTAGSQAINFISPATHLLTYVNNPTHNSSGMFGNATNSYANTNFNPSVDLTNANSLGLTIWGTSASTPTFGGIGGYSGTVGDLPGLQMNFNFNGTQSAAAAQGTTESVIVSNPAYDGCFTVTRRSTTDLEFYRNGSSLGTNTSSAVVGLPNVNLYIGCRNAAGTPSNFTGQNYIFFVVTDGLTASDVTNLYNDLNALKTGMGR